MNKQSKNHTDMSLNIIYRVATQKDVSQLYKLGKDTLPIYYEEEDFEEFIPNIKNNVFVAEIDNKIVGYCYSSVINKKRVHVNSFAVGSNFRRKKIGQTLMTMVINQAKTINAEIVTLYVMETNKEGIGFYKNFGFEIIEIKKHYYGVNSNGLVYAISIR